MAKLDTKWAEEDLRRAINILNHKNWLFIESNGSVSDGKDLFYPPEVKKSFNLIRLIMMKDYYKQMSSDAKSIIDFLMYADDDLLAEACGSPVKGVVNEKRVAKYFRSLWHSRLRVKNAIGEIKKLIDI